MSDDLAGKAVVVTGGATGIGRAAAEAFAEAGCRVLVHYHEGMDEARALEARGIAVHQADLTQSGAPALLIAEAVKRLGRLDVLVNNAGGLLARVLVADADDAFIDRVFDLNVRQLIHCCRAALPVMAAQRGGTIINVTSISARSGGSAGSSVYAGAKGFVSSFTRTLAKEVAHDGIRVNAVSPGTIHTAFHDRHSTPDKLEATRKLIPMARLGKAEDCAGAFLFLASDKASGYLTGQVIEVNGGQLMP
jgi:3-oxoacyl-[acyl-carrier protein] reductase